MCLCGCVGRLEWFYVAVEDAEYYSPFAELVKAVTVDDDSVVCTVGAPTVAPSPSPGVFLQSGVFDLGSWE